MAQRFYILDKTTELWITKYIIGEIFSSGGATLYKNPSDQTVATKLTSQYSAIMCRILVLQLFMFINAMVVVLGGDV